MWILISTYLAMLTVESTLVGLAFSVFMSASGRPHAPRWQWILVLVAVFAVLDTFYLPAVRVLDARLEIRNPEISRLIGPNAPVDLGELLYPGPGDLASWVIQGLIALLVWRVVTRRTPR